MTEDAERAWADIVTKARHTLALDTLHRAERMVHGDPDHDGLIADYGRGSAHLERIAADLEEHLSRSAEETADMMAQVRDHAGSASKPWDVGNVDDDWELDHSPDDF